VVALRLTAALNCCVALCGLGLAITGALLVHDHVSEDDFVFGVVGIAIVGTWSIVVLALNVLGVVCPRKPWMYVVGFVLLGCTVVCGGCWVAAVVGIIFWARAETRQWFQGGPDGSLG
jgi:hypothetical protein